jgi:UDP-N-acetylmuramate-alanine ligase
MKKYHFIAIGGAVMHNLALALVHKGYQVSGSDDEIYEPSRTRLERAGILPVDYGWFPEKISSDLDGIILGMHVSIIPNFCELKSWVSRYIPSLNLFTIKAAARSVSSSRDRMERRRSPP